MANERNQVIAVVGTPPKLHRYVEKMPDWVVAAANIVMDRYGGDAGSIWAGTPNAADVFGRLDAFPGVGQKKAATAVEILERDLRVPMRGMHESNIAYDVHVTRPSPNRHCQERRPRPHGERRPQGSP